MHSMKSLRFVVLVGMIAAIGSTADAKDAVDSRPSLAAFDNDVAVFRRVVRQYCAIAQNMMPATTVDKTRQAEALKLLKDARQKWAAIQQQYAASPPAEYARDKGFKGRLGDVSNALDDMETALAAGAVRRSFRACGFACGLFVAMHEQNGLNYALDKLFHLRKDIKTTTAVMKARGLDAAISRLPGLLQKRDAVLLAPPPFPPGHENAAAYANAVEELSSAMDQLALAAAAKDAKKMADILSNGVAIVNKPYGIAL